MQTPVIVATAPPRLPLPAPPSEAAPPPEPAPLASVIAPTETAGIARSPRATSDDDDALLTPARGGLVAALLGSRRNFAIAGGAVVLLIIIIAVAASGGDDKKKPVVASSDSANKPAPTEPAKADPSTATDEPAVAVERDPASARVTGTGTPSTSEEPVAATTEAPTEVATEPTTEPATTTETPVAPTPPRTPKATPKTTPKTSPKGKTLGGKQVVLEYDAQIKAAPKVVEAAPKADQAGISKARVSYAAGNQRLLAGDWDGAIRNYKQSLAYYPGYVAGYRGLGLAYSQAGDKAKALQSFRMYLGSVPTAKDAPLIRKRIATLQSQTR